MYILKESILPQGEKIKKIRKLIGVNQQELAGEKITRSLISYIENGKTKLVKETAEIIANNINKIAKEKNISLLTTADELMKDTNQQASEILENIIFKLKKFYNDEKIFNMELKKAKKLLSEWELPPQRAIVYTIAGNHHYNLLNYSKSYTYYMIALESYIKINDSINIAATFLNLAKCNLKLKQYEHAISINNYAIALLEKKNNNLHPFVKRAIFNNAIAYNELKMYDQCISELCKLEIKFNDFSNSQIVDILTLKANNYVGKEELEVALNIYKEIIKKSDKSNHTQSLILTYGNLAELYMKKQDINKSKEYLYKAIRLSTNTENELFDIVLYNLGVAYRKAHYFDLAENCLNNVKISAIKNNNSKIIVDIYEELIKIYIQSNLDTSIINTIEELQHLVEQYNNDIRTKNLDNIFILAGYYFIDKDVELSKSLLDFAIKPKIK